MNRLKLANIFQSGMVIQQNKVFKIWGYALPYSKIIITADWSNTKAFTIVEHDGTWQCSINVPSIVPGNFTSYNLTITDGIETIRLNNLLIGEIWIASGQSNMQYRMNCEEGRLNGVVDFETEIAAANYPNIRIFYVDLNFKFEPYTEVKGQWLSCSPTTIANFSGVSYYFMRELHQKLNVPIGLILCTIGASLSEAWTSRKTLEADHILFKNYLKPFDECYLSKEGLDESFTFEKVARPTLLFNAMIYPLRNLSIRGFIWYHGELNRNDRKNYLRLFKEMIKGWRLEFDQGELPFYYVQQPPYFWDREDDYHYDYAIFREFQSKARSLSNVGMAITIDDNQPRKLHPANKKMVGVRLANIALNQTYKLTGVPYLGPQIKKIELLNNTYKLTYSKNSLYGGLTTSDKQPIRQFEIAGADKIFHPAEAKIKKNNVLVSCNLVPNPVSLRYAFKNVAVTNLVNNEGLPAEPFRTDEYDHPKIITIVNTKGGVGKSTLALNLYNYWADKHKTLIVDIDNNGSLFLLKKHHPSLNIINEIDIFKIIKLPYDIIIIDTPPTKLPYIDGILSITNFVLLPTKMSLFDLLAIEPLVNQILQIQGRTASKSGIVMNKVKNIKGDNAEIMHYLKSISMRLLDTIISDRVSYNKSQVTAGIITNTIDKTANAEITSLAEEIMNILG